MPGFDVLSADGRILHAHPGTPDPLLGYHLKRLSYANDWPYRTTPLEQLTDAAPDAADLVILDFLGRPLRFQEWKADLQTMIAGSRASFLIVFPRSFSANVAPLADMNCEYCFWGFDGIDEMRLRLDLLRARSTQPVAPPAALRQPIAA